jgi:hypothetical protein
MATKITEQSAVGQVASFGGLITAVIFPIVLALAWFGDTIADTKYATDEDVLAVQQQVAQDVQIIKVAVEANTATVGATGKAVDGLTMVVLDLQIGELEAEIVELEAEKREDAAGWSERDETDLRGKQRALQSLDTQRTAAINRVLAQ